MAWRTGGGCPASPCHLAVVCSLASLYHFTDRPGSRCLGSQGVPAALKVQDYVFDLDCARVPQKYPGKRHFKGPRAGQLPGNPLGKNPSDVWILPNMKHNHPEKTVHPCQFPIELVDRLISATTRPGDIVLDPFAGVSSALCAAFCEIGGRAARK